jgi:acyl carrier protein phosphodiesterase
MMSVEKDIELHNLLIEHYKQQDWDSCQTTIDQLLGRWEGEVDSFYSDLLSRVDNLKNTTVSNDWSPVIYRP